MDDTKAGEHRCGFWVPGWEILQAWDWDCKQLGDHHTGHCWSNVPIRLALSGQE